MKFFVKSFIFLFISFVVIIISLYVYAYLSPKLDLKSCGCLYLYDNQNGLIYQGSRSNEWANLEDISQYLIDAVVAVEDKNFYNHHGFDYPRIAKAMLTNIKKKAIVQGASTISQQYIKNLYLDFDKTWERKIEEAFLTLELEVHYNKDEILEGYLNTINYGVFNMLPIPGLDGSRFVFLLLEAIRRKPVKKEHEALVHFVGMACLFLFMIFITIQDVTKFFVK